MHLSRLKICRPIASLNPASHECSQSTQACKPWKAIPGPSSLPIIGPLLHMLPGGSIGSRFGMEISDHFYKTYGPIVRLDSIFGRPNFLWIFEPALAAQMLRNETLPDRPSLVSMEYYRKTYDKKPVKYDGATGLITEQCEVWRMLRTAVNTAGLLNPNTIKLYDTVMDEVAADMVSRMKSIRDKNNMIRDTFDHEVNKWALESTGCVALGGRIGCLEANLPKHSAAWQLIQCAQEVVVLSNDLDFKPSIWRYYPTKQFKRAMEVYARQMELSKHFINKAVIEMKNKNAISQSTDEEMGVLEKLLAIDEKLAFIMGSDMLLAGIDTVTHSVIPLIYNLAKNPDKQDKLREEVLAGEGKQTYLKACIKESMRLQPAISGNIRNTTKEHNVRGYSVPKNTHVVFNHQYMATMEDQYPRAKEFLPERWLVPKDDPLYHGNAHPFAMMPFGFGARQCIGKRVTDLMMECFTSQLMKNFKIDFVGGKPLKIKNATINYVSGPYNFVFKDL